MKIETKLSPGETGYCLRGNKPVKVDINSIEIQIRKTDIAVFYRCDIPEEDDLYFTVREENIFTTPEELIESIKNKLEV